MSFVSDYLSQTVSIIHALDCDEIEHVVSALHSVKTSEGRLFLAGSGGNAASAQHAAADFRKFCGIEAYSVSDNICSLTADTNDISWAESYSTWLSFSRFSQDDCLMVLSVGGGSQSISQNLVQAMMLAKRRDGTILSIVGRNGGEAARLSTHLILIPPLYDLITPHTEEIQTVLLHLLAFHPSLQL